MSFDPEHGTLRLSDGLYLHRQLRRGDLMQDDREWEEWLQYRNEPVSYRWLGLDAYHGEDLVLIVSFWPDDGILREWHLGPMHLGDGAQARHDGPHTRALRDWFLKRYGATLPCQRMWGRIDAVYDPHNLCTTIFCKYGVLA
jgi:hypothetical protein